MINLNLSLMLLIADPGVFSSKCCPVGFMEDYLDAGDEVISGPR